MKKSLCVLMIILTVSGCLGLTACGKNSTGKETTSTTKAYSTYATLAMPTTTLPGTQPPASTGKRKPKSSIKNFPAPAEPIVSSKKEIPLLGISTSIHLCKETAKQVLFGGMYKDEIEGVYLSEYAPYSPLKGKIVPGSVLLSIGSERVKTIEKLTYMMTYCFDSSEEIEIKYAKFNFSEKNYTIETVKVSLAGAEK